jgi:PadR family transcriptional regulator, regulatory protein PadR
MDELASWQSQLRKGAVELAVLAVLADGEAYGLEILDRTNATGDLVADGALYPLLLRLEKAGRIAARWETEGPSANPRKYYRLTPAGNALLIEMRQLWEGFRTTIDHLLGKGHAR